MLIAYPQPAARDQDRAAGLHSSLPVRPPLSKKSPLNNLNKIVTKCNPWLSLPYAIILLLSKLSGRARVMQVNTSCVALEGVKSSAVPAILIAALAVLVGGCWQDAQAFGGRGGGHASGRGTAITGTRSHASPNGGRAATRNIQRFPNAHSRSATNHFGLEHRRIGWDRGHWHHERRRGLLGWWWDVGSLAYFYPEPFTGPPPYVSETEIPIEVEAETEPPRPTYRFLQQERQGAIYYAPGDNTGGVMYSNGTECAAAQRRAGDVGVCLIK
jgi:hypothetical protein